VSRRRFHFFFRGGLAESSLTFCANAVYGALVGEVHKNGAPAARRSLENVSDRNLMCSWDAAD
jgi:hypothetical protein